MLFNLLYHNQLIMKSSSVKNRPTLSSISLLKHEPGLKSPVGGNRRTHSILLTPFSAQEWNLAGVIAELINSITEFPDITNLGTMKPAHVVISRTSALINAVRQLTTACVDAVSKRHSSRTALEDITALKVIIHKATASAVDCIKESIKAEKLESDTRKQVLVDHLIDISHQANDMVEMATDVIRKMRDSIPDHLSYRSDSPKNSVPRNEAVTIEPDGEGFAMAVSFEASSNAICSTCNLRMSSSEEGIEYEDRVYHLDCFKCVSCTQPVTSLSFLTHQDKPLCSGCSPKCASCNDPVVTDCFLALEKTFHLDCFKCHLCNCVIPPDDNFYRREDSACCAKCMSNPRHSVFHQKWNPKMNTRFSQDLHTSEFSSGLATLKISERNEPSPQGPVPPPRSARARKRSDTTNISTVEPIPPKRKGSIQISMDGPDLQRLSKTSSTRRPLQSSTAHARTIAGVLSNEHGVDFMIRFCIEGFCVEKLFFWMDVEQFRQAVEKQPELSMEFVHQMHEKYIRPGAELEIVLHPKISANIERQIQKSTVSHSIFDAAQHAIFEDLEHSVLPRFLESSHGYRYLEKIMIQRIREQNGESVSNLLPSSMPSVEDLRNPMHLLALAIVDFEKRYVPEKQYVYEISLTRALHAFPDDYDLSNMPKRQLSPVIYRTFGEFEDLHFSLGKELPHLLTKLPLMPSKTGTIFKLGQVRSGKGLLLELSQYISRLLQVSPEIIKSKALSKFSTPTHDDLVNYEFKERLELPSP
eukprot:Partr_v1_DN28912_c1_g1_i2_m26115 putative PDZ and LIM domain